MMRKKTPTGFLAGVFLCLLVACGQQAPSALATAPHNSPACTPLPGGEWAELAGVVDGDTLRLKDGRTVRVLGINAPEVGRRGAAGEPFSRAASSEARSFLQNNPRIRLVPGEERKDRYGRLLAHVYRSDGASLEEQLLAQGLAFHTPVPPNLAQADCYAALESQARVARQGIWSDRGIQPTAAASVKEGGYQRVRGQITAVSFRRNWWIELDDTFTVVIPPADQGRFTRNDVTSWQGRRVEIKGWVYAANGEWRMKLETPWVIREDDS